MKRGEIMDGSIFMQFISSVGFPIAVCIALGYYIMWEKKRTDELFKTLKESIDNNTKSINKLSEKIGGMQK